MGTRQPRKVIWDMINTLFLTTVAVEPTFVAFHQHSQTQVRGLSCHSFKFLWRTGQTNLPTIPFGIVACTFSDNLSRNSCIHDLLDCKTVSFFPWDACGIHTVKNAAWLYPKIAKPGLRKIFIDYLFFQADQSDCTKSVSISNRFASSEERCNQNVPCQICRASVFPLVVQDGGLLTNEILRDADRYWQVTKGDLSQIIYFLRDSFLFMHQSIPPAPSAPPG